ncbi:MAG: four helix bundle protein [Sedimentisphaerales bacterium]|jgi:four helix bundle protein|nr:four helix bundle protein [Sedimentisphaerales bacterium]
MKSDELKDRTKNFAHRCVKLALALPKNTLGNHIRGQLIKCSTSVAANYRSVCIAQSKPDFISKLSIVIEEADETCFWMQFIIDEQLLKNQRVLPLLHEGRELTSILMSSRKTARGLQQPVVSSFL